MFRYRTSVAQLISIVWLPLFLLIGLSWLASPWLSHEHYGNLLLISNEEAKRHIWSSALRVDDVAAAIIALIAVITFKIKQQNYYVGLTLVVITCLLAIDGLFPDACYVGHSSCGLVSTGVSLVHDGETIILALAIAALSLRDALKRRFLSIAFVIVQLAAALIVIAGTANQQQMVVLQYIYETGMLFWLGWFIDRFNPADHRLHTLTLRRIVGGAAVVAGIFSIVAAAPHVHGILYHIHELPTGLPSIWLEQHGIIVGILILYLARHLLRGERPALWLAIILFYTQLLKYSILDPQPVAAVLCLGLLLLLITARHDFDRNTSTPSWLSRVIDVGLPLGGFSIAVVIVLGLLSITGHRAEFLTDAGHVYDHSQHSMLTQRRYTARAEHHLRVSIDTALISLGALTLWSIFQPRSLSGNRTGTSQRNDMELLIQQHSNNSEDYFKLWPTSGKQYYFNSDRQCGIAYRVEGATAFMLADPIASNDAQKSLTLIDFRTYLRRHGLTLCALAINIPSPELYREAGLQVWQIGSSASIDIQKFNDVTSRNKWWRWQYNRGKRSGWQHDIKLPPHSSELLGETKKISDAWLNRPGRSEQGFALGYYDDEYLQQCVIHVLRNENGNAIAFANQLPTYGSTAQASVDLIRFMPESDGAMPVLLRGVIASLKDSKYDTFDLGFVPLAKVDSRLGQFIRLIGSGRFSAAGLEQFKNKFDPTWHADYVAYDGDLLNIAQSASNLERLFRTDIE